MMYYYNDFYPFYFFGSVFMFLFWVFVIFGIILILRRNTNSENKNHAIEILKERYAKGEINKEQFEQMKKDLE